MIITGLDFGLIIAISYLVGVGSGISVVFKCKDNIIIRSRSRDNLSSMSHQGIAQIATPVIPSAPPPHNPTVTKMTLE